MTTRRTTPANLGIRARIGLKIAGVGLAMVPVSIRSALVDAIEVESALVRARAHGFEPDWGNVRWISARDGVTVAEAIDAALVNHLRKHGNVPS